MADTIPAEATAAAETVVIPVEAAREEYETNERNYECLLTEVKFSLAAEFKSRKMKIQSVTGRVKDIDSFLEKIERKRYVDPHRQAQDLVGVRVVALFLSDLRPIEEVIEALFEIIGKDDHVDGGPTEEFGYMSVHYVCRLGPGHAGPRYSGLHDFVFEIQVRTVVMDAWASISHHLGYKGASTIPSELRRDFNALSGLFYVADQHFELFFSRSKENEEIAEEAIESDEAEDLDIDLESMAALLRAVYPDREHGKRIVVSEFVKEVQTAGYRSIGQLERDLSDGKERGEESEKRNPPEVRSRKFMDVGLARRTLNVTNPEFKKVWDQKVEADRLAYTQQQLDLKAREEQ